MKKLILLLSVFSIFLVPSMSFAESFNDIVQGKNYVIYEDGNDRYLAILNNDNSKIYLHSSSTFYTYPQSYISRYVQNGSTYTFVNNTLVGAGYNALSFTNFINSTKDIYSQNMEDVFFSPPPVPITQISGVQELPQEILKHGGIVLSVALTGFGVLLVVSLIPRLVKRFLY